MTVVEPTGAWTFVLVQERMVEAIMFLDRVVPGGRNPFAGDGPWRLVVRDNRAGAQSGGDAADYVEPESDREVARRRGLRAAEVDRMEEALDWIRFAPEKRKVRALLGIVLQQLGEGGSQVDWARVRFRLGSGDTHDALRMTYSRSISAICIKLNRLRVPLSD